MVRMGKSVRFLEEVIRMPAGLEDILITIVFHLKLVSAMERAVAVRDKGL